MHLEPQADGHRPLHAYYDVRRMFPSSQLLAGWAKIHSNNSMSELAFLLPYIEQRPVFDAINMDFANIEESTIPSLENRTARSTRVALYLCPSDREPNHLNNFRFNRGRTHGAGHPPFDGPFSINMLPSSARITDGLARTAFVASASAAMSDTTHPTGCETSSPIPMSGTFAESLDHGHLAAPAEDGLLQMRALESIRNVART